MNNEQLRSKLHDLARSNTDDLITTNSSFKVMYEQLKFTPEEFSVEENLFIEINDLKGIDDYEWEIWDTFDFWIAERYDWDIKKGKFK